MFTAPSPRLRGEISEQAIRVVHLIGSTGIYGAERWILAQMRYVDQSMTAVSVINLVDRADEESAIVKEAQKRGYDAHDFHTGGRFSLVGALRLAKLVSRRGFTILHSHGYKSDTIGLIAAKLADVRAISTPHGWSKNGELKISVYEKIARLCLRFFNCVCPLSSTLYEGLYRSGIKASRLQLIPNGVDVEEIDEARTQSKVTEKKRIGYVGQFVEGKRLQDLVEGFFRLDRKDCELFLIGDGPCRKSILDRIGARNGHAVVHCPGYTATRLEYLKSFDVFVLPSLSEGTPRCIMEAHAARVPVVATNIPGVRTLVQPGQTGLLVAPRNPSSLAEAINRILNSPDLGERLASAGRKLVEERFSAATMAAEYQRLYLSFSNGPKSWKR
jgi:glycosyltransferase involved in cell wall biosynthesis